MCDIKQFYKMNLKISYEGKLNLGHFKTKHGDKYIGPQYNNYVLKL